MTSNSLPQLPPEVLILDLECETSKEGSHPNKGHKIYLTGAMYERRDSGRTGWVVTHLETTFTKSKRLLVGHNLKYDLAFLRAYPSRIEVRGDNYREGIYEHIRKHGSIWDTQLVTYLASGHSMLYPSLEEAAKFWGVATPNKLFDLGAELEKVDWDIREVPDLNEYLEQDVKLTAEIFLKQMESEWVKENLAWLFAMMQGLLALQELEHNGVHVDLKRFETLQKDLDIALEGAEARARAEIASLQSNSVAAAVEITSNDQLAKVFFGGGLTVTDKEQIGVYASGKKMGMPRYKVIKTDIELEPICDPDGPAKNGWLTDSGKISMSSGTLLQIKATHNHVKELVESILHYREIAKLQSTYVSGLQKHLLLDAHGKCYIHPTYNACATATGRTSCVKPNLQNSPTNDSVGVTSIYTSRYGENGRLLEVDFKQLEVLALAVLSQDQALINDIKAGVDVHEVTGRRVFGAGMSKEQRRVCKGINFGMIYGGGAKTLSEQSGQPISIVKKLIKAWEDTYPKTVDYFAVFERNIQRKLDLTGIPTGSRTKGVMQKSTIFQSATGRRYSFSDFWNDFSNTMQVSHTQTRNYPIQGLATADLMLNEIGIVWRHIMPQYGNDVKMVGLIHDSLRFDIKDLDTAKKLALQLKCNLEKAGEHLNKRCPNLNWNVPLKVEFSIGKNFHEMEEFEYA